MTPMSKGFASTYRIVLLAGVLLACFGCLGGRLVWLHVVDREALLATIVQTRRHITLEQARRGDILDAHGQKLATSRSLIVLGVDPSMVVATEQERQKWPRLAALVGMPEPELRRILTTKYRASSSAGPSAARPAPPTPALAPFAAAGAPAAARPNLGFSLERSKAGPLPAADEVDDTELDLQADPQGRRAIRWAKLRDDVPDALYDEIKQLGVAGLTGDRVFRRTYPNNQLAAHLVGYVNREERPAAGIEYYTDFYLRGQNGWRVGERDGRGRELAQFRTREVPRADGYKVMLSIDANVQSIVEQELDSLATRFQPQKATIIVSDPKTGFILAMANYPTFNLNEYHRVPKEEQARMKNVAVADVYEPGSVFKIVAAAAALEERVASLTETFDCALERVDYRGRSLKLPGEDHRFTHELTVAEIISRSSNRGAAQLGLRLGEDRLYRYARAFGFGSRLGFPVGGEVGGSLAPPARWDGLTITRLPMGHAVDCTVLQMHQAMSTIANGGRLLRPQVINAIHDASGERVFTYGAEEIGRAVSVSTARTMAALLMGVASKDGTAPEAAIPGFDVAGKTGTTQKIIDGRYSDRHHVASFVGFFPAQPRPGDPQVAISVIVDDADARAPGGIAYGRTVAAPSFKTIGEQLIPILEIKSPHPSVRPPLVAATEGGRR